jgi:hypothetical protein
MLNGSAAFISSLGNIIQAINTSPTEILLLLIVHKNPYQIKSVYK